MGCLFEFIFDLFFEVVLELVGKTYVCLMQLIVPEKNVSVRARKIIKKAVLVAAAILMLAVIIGFILWIQEDIWVKNVGKYMTLISIGIIVFQIILGIAVRLIGRYKNK